MVPTIHDVVGAPVPGLSGLRPTPRPETAQFRDLLQQILGPGIERALAARGPAASSRVRPSVAAKPGTLPPATASAPRSSAVRAVHRAPSVVRRSVVTGAQGKAGRAALASAIRQAASDAGVEPALSVGVARVESNLNPAARSPDGISHGTFQVTHTTAKEMRRRFASGAVTRPAGTDDVALGVGYLRYLHDLFSRSAKLGKGVSTTPIADPHERKLFAIAAFNAGEGRVAQAQARASAAGQDPTRFADIRRYLPAITQTYVQRVSTFAREEAGGMQLA